MKIVVSASGKDVDSPVNPRFGSISKAYQANQLEALSSGKIQSGPGQPGPGKMGGRAMGGGKGTGKGPER